MHLYMHNLWLCDENKRSEHCFFLGFFQLKRKSHQCQGCTLESDLARHPLAEFHLSPHQPLAMLFSDCHVGLASELSRPLLTSNLRDNRDPFPGPVVRPNAASFALRNSLNLPTWSSSSAWYFPTSEHDCHLHTHSDSIGSLSLVLKASTYPSVGLYLGSSYLCVSFLKALSTLLCCKGQVYMAKSADLLTGLKIRPWFYWAAARCHCVTAQI